MQFIFPVSLFTSAVLLFFIQPMVAKALLPVYGGTPAVWTICMLFFQALLLVSYAYAWFLSQLRHSWSWRILHAVLAVISVFALPFVFKAQASLQLPELGILYTLLMQLGLPLLIVGASAPLLQYAYSQTGAKRASDPYFLYVASNTGSLLALLSYPWLVERYIGLATQFQIWCLGYGIYLLLLLWILFAKNYQPVKKPHEDYISPPVSQVLWWVFLSFTACSLMLGVTFYITTDVAATPLFWILPLALYLLTFIITFASKPIIPHAWVVRNTLFVLIFPVLGFILGSHQILAWQMVLFHLAAFFMLALLCHGELIRSRPKVQGLTLFYFSMAFGGVLAGVFNGLVAPRLFNQPYEYPLMMALALLALPIKRQKGDLWMPFTVAAILLVDAFLLQTTWGRFFQTWHIAEILALLVLSIWQTSARSLSLALLILFVFLFTPWFKQSQVLVQKRNFYGIKQVNLLHNAHALMSQTTIHGFQLLNKSKLDGSVAYYGAIKPVSDLMKAQKESLNVTVLGLGAGIVVCQFRGTDVLSLVEIDEQVIQIAKNPAYFTYLKDCPSEKKFIVDDGRMALTKMKDASDDIIIVDAFSSDAIPVHLLTSEAFGLYKQKVNEKGVILVNISNRHMDLLPVLTAAGREHDLIVLQSLHPGDSKKGQFPSQWVLLTMNQPLALHLMKKPYWHFVADGETHLWTDDYSNIIPLMKW